MHNWQIKYLAKSNDAQKKCVFNDLDNIKTKWLDKQIDRSFLFVKLNGIYFQSNLALVCVFCAFVIYYINRITISWRVYGQRRKIGFD